jgi:hypothetical protein
MFQFDDASAVGRNWNMIQSDHIERIIFGRLVVVTIGA